MKGGHQNHAWMKISRDRAWTRQGCKCAYCLSKIKRGDVTADHIKPKALGGTDAKNIAAACAFCNKAKGKVPVQKFKRMINGGAHAPNVYVDMVRIYRSINRQTDAACKRILASVGMCHE